MRVETIGLLNVALGFTGELQAVRKVDYYYYVVGSLGNVYLPTTLDDLEDFRDRLKRLFYFKVGEIMPLSTTYTHPF